MTQVAIPRSSLVRVVSRTFRAFQYRDFRLLWLGAFTSTTGTFVQMVALSWLVLDLTDSAFYLGLTSFLGELPVLLFTLVGGAVADRIDRRKLLVSSQYVQMTCAFILTALVLLGVIQVNSILLLVFLAGTAQAFGGPAYQALIPGLVDRQDMPNAIALNSIQFNLARVVGPLLAAVALAWVGAALCFALNGLSFVAVVITLYLIQARFVPQRTDESILRGIRNGLAFVRSKGPLWQLSVLGFISTFCGIPVITLLPVFARDIFDLGASGYSTMMAASGAGSIAGALLYAGASHIERRGLLTLWVQLGLAFFLTVFALSRSLALSYICLFLGGICLMTLFASITSLVQLATTEEMRGRVMSIFMLAFRGGMPLGSLAAGYLAVRLTPTSTLLLGAGILAAAALSFLLSRSAVKSL